MNVLVIGRGSIGKKHLATLRASARPLTVHEFMPEEHGAGYLAALSAELTEKKIDAAFICNPTSLHMETALVCANHGAHIFLEKPIAATFDAGAFRKLEKLITEKGRTVMVGYDMRFNPFIEKAQALLASGAIGDVWSMRIFAGQYLPEWRPGKDYRETYSAKRAEGGGVLLDLSHELDYLLWLLPKRIERVFALNIHTNRLETDTEDIAALTISYEDRSVAEVHLDYLAVPYRRSLEAYGTEGTLIWDDVAKTLRLFSKKTGAWETVAVEAKSTAEIFAAEVEHFFTSIEHASEPRNSFASSVRVMKLIDAAVRSSKEGKSRTLSL